MTLLTRLFRSPRKAGPLPKIELLSRPGCHLCEEALQALAREMPGADIKVVDITEDGSLEEKFVFRIPVVLHQGDVLAEGVIDRPVARRVKHMLNRRLNSTVERK